MRKTLAVCALLLASLPARAATDVAGEPTGEGDPAEVVCRGPQIIPGTRRRGPKVCKTNAIWAQYREDGMTVAADGTHDIAVGKGKSCQVQGASAGGTSSARGMGTSITCD